MTPRWMVVALVVAACKGGAHRASDVAPTIAGSATLERLACFGTCPVYSVNVSADGSVRFFGRRNVAVGGAAEGRIEPSAARALLSEFDKVGFFAMDSMYEAGRPNCRIYATDHPTIVFDATAGSKSHRVVWDSGCMEAPHAIEMLATRFDSVTNSKRWITGGR